jgi:hypothetical protein
LDIVAQRSNGSEPGDYDAAFIGIGHIKSKRAAVQRCEAAL